MSDIRILHKRWCMVPHYSVIDPNTVHPHREAHQCIGPHDTSQPIKFVLCQLSEPAFRTELARPARSTSCHGLLDIVEVAPGNIRFRRRVLLLKTTVWKRPHASSVFHLPSLPSCSRKNPLFGRVLTARTWGVSIGVHYIAFWQGPH